MRHTERLPKIFICHAVVKIQNVDYSRLMNLTVHRYIFEIIAPLYNCFFKSQYDHYVKILLQHGNLLDVSSESRVLEIGCGTGAFAKAFSARGFSVTGVDIARNMVALGKKRGLDCLYGNALTELPFPDKSFDLVVFSYVAHGLDREKRERLFKEAARLAKRTVLVHDYGTERHVGTTLIEFLEGGDYFNFIRTGEEEMRGVFPKVSVFSVGKNACWYICKP